MNAAHRPCCGMVLWAFYKVRFLIMWRRGIEIWNHQRTKARANTKARADLKEPRSSIHSANNRCFKFLRGSCRSEISSLTPFLLFSSDCNTTYYRVSLTSRTFLRSQILHITSQFVTAQFELHRCACESPLL